MFPRLPEELPEGPLIYRFVGGSLHNQHIELFPCRKVTLKEGETYLCIELYSNSGYYYEFHLEETIDLVYIVE